MPMPPGIVYISQARIRWLAVVAAVLTQPILSGLRGLYADISARRDARRRGAVEISRVPDRYVGLGLEILKAMGKALTVGYPVPAKQGSASAWLSQGQRSVGRDQREMWKFHRSMTRPYFSRGRVTDFDIFDKHAKDVLDLASARLREGYPVDIQDIAARFTLDLATAFLFGDSVDSISAGLARIQSLRHISPPRRSSTIPLIHFKWQLGEFWKDLIQPHREVIDKFIEPIIQRALSEKLRRAAASTEANTDSDQEVETLLGHLLKSTEDKAIIRDEILNMLVAGRDTTSATITFAIYMLAEHPDKARRLREEILDRVGPSRRPTHDDVKNMPYLRAFINETLRLYPPVPVDSRTSKNATTWPSTTPGGPPLYVPANTKIIYTIFLMHRRKDLWGPDGPRICLGQQFAYQFFLIRLLQRFCAIHLAPDAQPDSKPPAHWKLSGLKKQEKITYGTSLTMYAKDGVWVRMDTA
ncbi:cytochrome P450 monooxygenase pc-3 [Mycena amicta]|nr:cytochrome P450 monooxygenase pc-3 [Mycena amicta]